MLLLVHGTGAWSGTWFELPPALAAAGWRVVAVDLPPFGFSAANGRPGELDYSRTAQADRLLRLIASLADAGEVTLVGHSFGAGPALEAAMRSPSRLRRLVLVNPALGLGPAGEARPAPGSRLGGMALGRRDVRSTLISGSRTYPDFTARLSQLRSHRQGGGDARARCRLSVPMRGSTSAPTSATGYTFASAGCEPAASLDPLKLTAWAANAPPVVLLWGSEDTVTPLAQARALLRWMPGAILVELPGLGHIPHIEDPAAFATALLGAVGPVEPVARPAVPGTKPSQRKDARP